MPRMHLFAKEKVVFAPAVAGTSPTRGEINAGVVLVLPGVYSDDDLVEMTGFENAASFISVPDGSTDTVGKIPGRKETGDASMTFYESTTVATKRNALAEGTSGFIIRMPYGDVPTKRCEVWPITVSAVNGSQITSGNDAATFAVGVAITGQPTKDAVIPA